MHQYLSLEGKKALQQTIFEVISLINCACDYSPDIATRKAFLHDKLNNRKSGQNTLPIDEYLTDKKLKKGVN